MKKYYITLALLIAFLSACSSNGNDAATPEVKHDEGTGVTETAHSEASAATNAAEESESFTLITDDGTGVTNNQDTEKPDNY
jgi:ABC-type Fe3+-hydroxamate transport system substrate-binding protein